MGLALYGSSIPGEHIFSLPIGRGEEWRLLEWEEWLRSSA